MATRLLPDLPTGGVEFIDQLLGHDVLVSVADLLAQAADQLERLAQRPF